MLELVGNKSDGSHKCRVCERRVKEDMPVIRFNISGTAFNLCLKCSKLMYQRLSIINKLSEELGYNLAHIE